MLTTVPFLHSGNAANNKRPFRTTVASVALVADSRGVFFAVGRFGLGLSSSVQFV